MNSRELREGYIRYFEERGHKRVPSDSLLPSNDPTLLFTNAGMVQFKPLFIAASKPYSRATSSQRCLRTIDIDLVGITRRHLTLFEMLGNFSFGDYFKEGAIEYAWDFLTRILKLDPERLAVTVFEEDREAEGLWRRFLPDGKITRLGDEDNYWPTASALKTWSGPNGPCSEIFYDFGPEQCRLAGFSSPCSRPGEHECERFRETWTLVFPQFNRSAEGDNPPMPKPGIDTGMGLERMMTVLQGKDSVFETDLFEPIIKESQRLLKPAPGQGEEELRRARRIVADHTRAAVFLVSDGVVPSNEAHGYVLRRLIRRAARQTALFGEARAIVSELVPCVSREMGDAYPEIRGREAQIASTIQAEEIRFIDTLQRGLEELQKEGSSGRAKLDGKRAFFLYDTFGFPRELTEDIWVREMGRKLAPGFAEDYERALGEQQERARAAWRGSGDRKLADLQQRLSRELAATKFLGYEQFSAAGKVVAVVRGTERESEARAGEKVEVVLEATPFYAESGGQAGDRGTFTAAGLNASVLDVRKLPGDVFVHSVKIESGTLREGDTVSGHVDESRRMAAARHHTATHLLHGALHRVLGRSATQAGSYVGPDRLRFDFMNPQAVPAADLRMIEDIVNEKVLENLPVEASVISLEEAKKKGVVMLFGEKYGAKVRMIEVRGFSRELCGGTHVSATSLIGPFVIVSEGAVAAGVRRVEALAGGPALEYLRARRADLENMAALLRCPAPDAKARLVKLMEEQRAMANAVRELKGKAARKDLAGRREGLSRMGEVPVLITEAEAGEPAVLRDLADQAMAELGGEGIAVLGSRTADKCHILVRVSPGLTGRVRAPDVIKEAAAAVGGSGGGKPEMAQAGGKTPERLPEALERARAYLAGVLGS